MATGAQTLDPAFLDAFRSGTLTPEQAEAVLPRDRAASIFFLLQLSITLGTPAFGGAHTGLGASRAKVDPNRVTRGCRHRLTLHAEPAAGLR